MKITEEQRKIISSAGNIKVNAVAGSGKTTTVIEYARSRPAGSRILYLVFNKSVRLEAKHKFESEGLPNVKVETAHSLAYQYVMSRGSYKVRNQGYKTHEIATILRLQGNGEKHNQYIVANHISKCIAYFCNSSALKLKDLNYTDIITDKKVKALITPLRAHIENQTRVFLNKMDKGEIGITHDFYLKKFQLSAPQLPYDYILFDEGQDASPAMIDIFLKQDAVKVIVGDMHQQIYSWRFAVNSLEKADFSTHYLSASFRFNQEIADLAMAVLSWKKRIGKESELRILGKGTAGKSVTKAIIARTNLGLLLKAIEHVTENENAGSIYFEGNISSYTYADEGASLYDVLNLNNGKRKLIRDPLISEMKNMEELEDYIKKTEDVQLGMMVEIVKEYGSEIPGIIRKIKEKHVENDNKMQAGMIFSTVHRCKGIEYDSVQLANDFITEKKLEKITGSIKKEDLNITKLNEEINLLYVAITRAKHSIYIPETLLPENFSASGCIHVLKVQPPEPETEPEPPVVWNTEPASQKIKSYSVEEFRTRHSGAYKPWTSQLDDELTTMFCEGINIKDLARHFGRTRGAIRSRIKKLELEELYGSD
jgi:superfamily I DNA/RNA helicase